MTRKQLYHLIDQGLFAAALFGFFAVLFWLAGGGQ